MANVLTAEPPRIHPETIETELLELGRKLGTRARAARSAKDAAYERSMSLVARDPELRAALFRLVDVAPACAGNPELAAHLAAYLDGVDTGSFVVRLGSRIANASALERPTGRIAAMMVRQMARRFIAGETIAEAEPGLRRLWAGGTASTVDLLGEATVTSAEGQAYAERCDQALVVLADAAKGWPSHPLLEGDSAGPLPRVNLSVKVTALTPLVRAAAPGRGREDAARAIRPLLRRAAELGAHLHIDMESLDSRELIVGLLTDVLEDDEFKAGPSIGMVLQAYLRDSEEVLDRILESVRAADRTTPLTIRLVKGAYWDHETIEAAQNGWTPPVWTEKAESDRCFERLARRLVDEFPLVRPAFASHNLRSVAFAATYARHAGLAERDVEFQVLRGLGDDLQQAIVAGGMRCRAYSPVGDMVAGMAYLVRRLLENTSNASFLASQAAGTDFEELLQRP